MLVDRLELGWREALEEGLHARHRRRRRSITRCRWRRGAAVVLRQLVERLQELRVHGVLDLPAHIHDGIVASDELKLIALELRVARFEALACGIEGRGEAIVIRL